MACIIVVRLAPQSTQRIALRHQLVPKCLQNWLARQRRQSWRRRRSEIYPQLTCTLTLAWSFLSSHHATWVSRGCVAMRPWALALPDNSSTKAESEPNNSVIKESSNCRHQSVAMSAGTWLDQTRRHNRLFGSLWEELNPSRSQLWALVSESAESTSAGIDQRPPAEEVRTPRR